MRKTTKRARRQSMVEYLLIVLLVAGFTTKLSVGYKDVIDGAFKQCAREITVNLTDVLTGRRRPGGRP